MPRTTAQLLTVSRNTAEMAPASRPLMHPDDQFAINIAIELLRATDPGDVSKAVRRARSAAAQTIHRLLLPAAFVANGEIQPSDD